MIVRVAREHDLLAQSDLVLQAGLASAAMMDRQRDDAVAKLPVASRLAKFGDDTRELVPEDDALHGSAAQFLHMEIGAADADARHLQAHFAGAGTRAFDLADGEGFAATGEYGGAH